MRPLLLCAFTVFASLTTIAAAEELANGVYVLSWEGPGIEIRRADTYGKVFLGKQVGTKLRDASIKSISNDNTLYQLALTIDGLDEGADQQHLALVIAGYCMPIGSHGNREAGGSMNASALLRGSESADAVAKQLSIQPARRKHPGHQLLVSLAPQKGAPYRPGEQVMLRMTLRNAGTAPLRFMDGGSQRGARNNQFRFIAFRSGGSAIPDVGDPDNHGGMASYITIGPNESFTKPVELTHWFKLNQPGAYDITGLYQMELMDEKSNRIWDEFAVGTCTIRIEGEGEIELEKSDP